MSNILCRSCGGHGWISYGEEDPRNPQFGEIYPCPLCYPDHQPYKAGDEEADWGVCPHHNMPYRKFRNGRVGHNAGQPDNPLWCMKGGAPPEKQLTNYWEQAWREGFQEMQAQVGNVWCPLHRQFEPLDDPYDFPVSRSFLDWAAHQGYCREYPDPVPPVKVEESVTPAERRRMQPRLIVHLWPDAQGGGFLPSKTGQTAPGRGKPPPPPPAPSPQGVRRQGITGAFDQ